MDETTIDSLREELRQARIVMRLAQDEPERIERTDEVRRIMLQMKDLKASGEVAELQY